jgi:hypothetical protein
LACRERQIEVLASFDRDFDHIFWLKRIALSEDVTALFTVTDKPPADQE